MTADPLLLDTHALLWFLMGSAELKPPTVRRLGAAAAAGELLVSPISFWEIAMLAARGRIALGMPCRAWVDTALRTPGLSVLPLSPQAAVEAAELPGRFHADPADRMLVASGRIHAATLVTRDRRILEYASEGMVRALRC